LCTERMKRVIECMVHVSSRYIHWYVDPSESGPPQAHVGVKRGRRSLEARTGRGGKGAALSRREWGSGEGRLHPCGQGKASRAEQSRAEQSRAEQSRAEQSRAPHRLQCAATATAHFMRAQVRAQHTSQAGKRSRQREKQEHIQIHQSTNQQTKESNKMRGVGSKAPKKTNERRRVGGSFSCIFFFLPSGWGCDHRLSR
jgi:hypothetical protein